MPTYLYFLLWGAFFLLMMRYGCGARIMGHGHGQSRDAAEPGGASTTDNTTAAASMGSKNDQHH